MFTLADNERIGKYLASRIDERFESQREFCREYLKAIGRETSDDQVQRMANRLSQIIKGKKEIQLYDLPVFCRLLEVSCEDILSAGESHAPVSSRSTNYAIAFSNDERAWEEYATRENSPILNADEYGKTVIDYALEAANFDFLKYLMDKKYIRFVGADKENRFKRFGAETSMEQASILHLGNLNTPDSLLKRRDDLRTQMIVLAIQHEDMEMLEQLRAREIPTLYQLSYYLSSPEDCCGKYRNEKLMDALAHADDSVLEFFSGEFEITTENGFADRFTFPFLGELIESLLQTKNGFAEYMLKAAIRHNQYVYDQLTALLSDSVQFYRKYDYDLMSSTMQDDLKKEILKDLNFYSNGTLIRYFTARANAKKGLKDLRSNIIRVNTESSDTKINRLISELNGLYDAIHHITPKFEGENENDVL